MEPLPAPSGLATKEPFAAEGMEEVHMEFDVLAASNQNSLLFPWINNDGRTIMVGYSNEKGEALALEVNARLGEPDFVTIYEVPYSWYELSEVADLLGDGTFVESWVDPQNDVAVLRVAEDTPEVRERIVKAGFADRAVLLVDPDWVEPVLG